MVRRVVFHCQRPHFRERWRGDRERPPNSPGCLLSAADDSRGAGRRIISSGQDVTGADVTYRRRLFVSEMNGNAIGNKSVPAWTELFPCMWSEVPGTDADTCR